MRRPDFYTAAAPMAFIAGFVWVYLSMAYLKVPGWLQLDSLQPLVLMGKLQPHLAGALSVFSVICGVLLGYLHQRASLWIAGSSGAPAQTGDPVHR